MSAGVPHAPHLDSTIDSGAVRGAAERVAGVADTTGRTRSLLKRLVDAEAALHWAARVRTGYPTEQRADGLSADTRVALDVVIWPAATSEPPGVRELAVRAAATGRVTRALMPDTADGACDELVAVPDAALSRSTSVVSSVLVVASRGLVELDRAALIRRLREALVPSGDLPPGQATAPTAIPTLAAPSLLMPATADVTSSLAEAVLAAVGAHGDVASVALATAEHCARCFDAQRVTIGVERRGAIELLAMSGETRADRRRAINRLMLAFMSEVVARGQSLSLPAPDSEDSPASFHELQAANRGMPLMASMQTAPSGVRVVIVVERSPDACVTDDDVVALEAALAPTLVLLGQLESGGLGRLERAVAGLRRTLHELRCGKPSSRLIGLLCIATLTGLWLFYPLPYRISGRVSVEASDRQVLVAPYAGHLLSAATRAGDTVEAGQVLATLDDRELQLARDKWLSETNKNSTDQARALAVRDRVELARLRADAQRLEAELSLVDQRRARSIVRAPFDGVILSGDPTRSLGAPVSAGEVLFEIARGDRRTVLVEIDEQDIALIDSDAAAEVRMAAMPRRVFETSLDQRIPVAVAEAGRNVFRVPATLQDIDQSALSPGMQGVARVDAGPRSLASAWTRSLRQRLLLLTWKAGLIR